jgi:hypothetical protein
MRVRLGSIEYDWLWTSQQSQWPRMPTTTDLFSCSLRRIADKSGRCISYLYTILLAFNESTARIERTRVYFPSYLPTRIRAYAHPNVRKHVGVSRGRIRMHVCVHTWPVGRGRAFPSCSSFLMLAANIYVCALIVMRGMLPGFAYVGRRARTGRNCSGRRCCLRPSLLKFLCFARHV